MKTLVLLIGCGFAAAYAQEAPKTLWAHVDFVDIPAGKAADYHKALKDMVVPKHQERVRGGDEYAFVNYNRMFPHGSGLPSEEIRLQLSRTMKGGAENHTRGTGIPAGLFHTAQGELWRMRHSVNLDKFLQSPVVRVLFLRTRDGKSNNDTLEIYRNGDAGKDTSKFNGFVIFDRLFPGGGGSGDFTMAVLWGYADMAQIDAVYEQAGSSPARTLDIERLKQVRDVVRMELWTRRPEFVVPQ